MAKVLLCRTAHLVELSDNQEVNKGELRLIEGLIERDFRIDGITFKWISSNPVLLDTSIDNIGKCCRCGAWTTDCANDQPENDLSFGARIKGDLFCDICLPKGHSLRFTNT